MSLVSRKRKAAKRKKKQQSGLHNKAKVKYICLQCDITEEIPLSVVRDFDAMDDGDPTVPPKFRCEECGGAMYPEYYKGLHGYEYRIGDVRD
ncbi:hypothetical protein J19TS2_40850 [Cohnella xylanilytica]|nr:hypothetical protein J19TS2_40850 [Cohnella xylanilytica]